MVSELCVDVLLKGGGTVVVLCVGGVVSPAVGEHPLHVGDEQPLVAVVVGLQPLVHRLNQTGEFLQSSSPRCIKVYPDPNELMILTSLCLNGYINGGRNTDIR